MKTSTRLARTTMTHGESVIVHFLFLVAEVRLPPGVYYLSEGCWVRIDARLPAQSYQPLLRTANAPPAAVLRLAPTTFAILRLSSPLPHLYYDTRLYSLTDPSINFPFYSCSIASIDHRIEQISFITRAG